MYAAAKYKVKHIAVGGGVAANGELRAQMAAAAKERGIDAVFVDKALSSDNAAMIALAAYKKIERAPRAAANKKINPNMRLKNWK
jgi:N6-L-threonylcarbamoyladenine synthase